MRRLSALVGLVGLVLASFPAPALSLERAGTVDDDSASPEPAVALRAESAPERGVGTARLRVPEPVAAFRTLPSPAPLRRAFTDGLARRVHRPGLRAPRESAEPPLPAR